jgi:hypothetical protein
LKGKLRFLEVTTKGNMLTFFRDNGIIHEASCVGTTQQNEVAERKSRHILEITRSLLFENIVP